jgi:hypothetical protein
MTSIDRLCELAMDPATNQAGCYVIVPDVSASSGDVERGLTAHDMLPAAAEVNPERQEHVMATTITDAGMRWIVVAPPGAHCGLALTAGTGGIDTGIRLTATDVAHEHGATTAHHVDVDDVPRWPGVAMFRFRDPDDNTLYVIETDR